MIHRAVAMAVLLVSTPAGAFIPAQVVHRMVGQMVAAERGNVHVMLRVDCVFYEDFPSCSGSYRCKSDRLEGVPHDRKCSHGKAKAHLELTAGGYTYGDDEDPSVRGFATISFRDGVSCRLDGMAPYFFSSLHVEVPGMFGHYTCLDALGVEIERGVFGFRTRSVGKPFYGTR